MVFDSNNKTMDIEELRKKFRIEKCWRSYVEKYVDLHTALRKEQKSISPEKFAKNEGINKDAFKWWLKFIKLEDKYVFYCSFASEYLNRALKSLDILDDYIDTDNRLRMPLLRDSIIAYAALFLKNKGRVFTKWHLDTQDFVPQHLNSIHQKICTDRDIIFAHCDIDARNPRVSLVGISMKGFYWDEYRAMLPQFRELINSVSLALDVYDAILPFSIRI